MVKYFNFVLIFFYAENNCFKHCITTEKKNIFLEKFKVSNKSLKKFLGLSNFPHCFGPDNYFLILILRRPPNF